MDAQDIQHYSVKLKYGRGGEVTNIVEEIFRTLDGRPFPTELLPAFMEAYRKDKNSIFGNRLAQVIANTKSMELYQLCRERDAIKGWPLINLLFAGIPDPWIEQKLDEMLHKSYPNDSDPNRRQIVRAMAVHGTKVSLELLEFISLELADSIPVRVYDFNQQPEAETPLELADKMIPALELNAAISFREEVDKAVQQIKARLQNNPIR